MALSQSSEAHRTWQGHEKLRDSIQWACSAGPIVLWNGEAKVLDQGVFPGIQGVQPNSRVQRVAIGLTRYRDQAVFVYHPSATALEMGEILKAEGCFTGILGDGGSSASMVTPEKWIGTQLVPNAIMWTQPDQDERVPLICIDPGHGGVDPGATGNGLLEKDIVLDLGLKLRDRLERDYQCQVMMTRIRDIRLGNTLAEDLSARVRIANEAGVDLFLSIHCNGHSNTSVNGYEDFIHPDAPKRTQDIRDVIHEPSAALWISEGRANRGKKTANFQVLRQTVMPAVLQEHGFVTNTRDAELLKDLAFRTRLTDAMARGVAKSIGLERRDQESMPGNETRIRQLETALQEIRALADSALREE